MILSNTGQLSKCPIVTHLAYQNILVSKYHFPFLGITNKFNNFNISLFIISFKEEKIHSKRRPAIRKVIVLYVLLLYLLA